MIFVFLLCAGNMENQLHDGRDDDVGPLRENMLRHGKHQVLAGDTIVIEAQNPGLTVLFHQVYGTSITAYADGFVYENDTDPSGLAGLDFGGSIGKLIFTAREDTTIDYSALVFPRDCLSHRLISTYLDDEVYFSKDSHDPDYRITSSQTFCFWPALPVRKNYRIKTKTEKSFDRIIRIAPQGQIGDYSGESDTTLKSGQGLDFFKWTSDATTISDNFYINVSSLEFFRGPMVRRMLFGFGALDVSPFYQNFPFPKPTPRATDESPTILNRLLPALTAITSILVVTAVLLMIWAVKSCRGDKGDDSDDGFTFEDEDDEQSPSRPLMVDKKNYKAAKSDHDLPQPFYHPNLETPQIL